MSQENPNGVAPFAEGIGRRSLLGRGAALVAAMPAVSGMLTSAQAQSAPLPSWNDGPAKQAILDFVCATRARFRATGRAHRR